ncbi:MAG: zf-HC2 domain-containing protein [Thermoanaerobaculia bacterium]
MTAPMLMTDHPTEETLAAYVDDRLDAPTRRKVTEHLAACGECREVVVMTTDYQASETPANVVRGTFGWIASAAALAAAAVIAIFVLRPDALFPPRMDDVYREARDLKTLPSDGRPAGDFPYKRPYSPPRGDPHEVDVNAKLVEIALTAKDPHVKGMAFLLISDTDRELYGEAMAALEEAYRSATPENRDAIAIDLATALLSTWSTEKGYERALELSDEVLKRKPQSPEARWNRAAALERLGRDKEAIAAWDDYLTLDRNSEWGKEAEKRQRKLVELN